MRGHVIWTLGRVRIKWIIFFNQAVQPLLQITSRRRVCILLNGQTGGSVLDKYCAEPFLYLSLVNNRFDLWGDLVKALTLRAN